MVWQRTIKRDRHDGLPHGHRLLHYEAKVVDAIGRIIHGPAAAMDKGANRELRVVES